MKFSILKTYILFSLISTFMACSGGTSKKESTSSESSTTQTEVKDKETKDDSKAEKEYVKIVSWNLYNFGNSKSEEEIRYIAEKINDYHIVAIQEVSTSPAGAQTVAKLADELNRMGKKWDYIVSDPTEGAGTERYAYLWQTAKVKIPGKRGWLSEEIADKVDREPYLSRFELVKTGKKLLLASFHAVPSSKDPEKEIVFLDDMFEKYKKNDNAMVMGDFNLSQKHASYNELKSLGFEPCITDQKTSLKMKEKEGEKLAEEYDNIFYEKKDFKLRKQGVLHFYEDFKTLKEARTISDHIPVWVEVEVL